jgi:endoglucanase
MDDVVAYAHVIGLKIILDDHVSSAPRPMEVNSAYEPLWYTPRYPESSWIHDWQTLAQRYRNDDAVIGFDLRNEPHPSGSGPWNLAAYLRRGPTWGPYHGVDDPATDWRLAAERAGNAILSINPHLLIIVQGLPLYPDRAASRGVNSSWWAGILSPVRRYPVQLQVLHQIVYAVHEWGPQKQLMPWFIHMTYRSLVRAWHKNWSFIFDHPNAPYAAPILLGEFGTCNTDTYCVGSDQPGSQGAWFRMLMRYLRAHPALSWSFYALNGTNSNNCLAGNGLLNARWNNVSNLSLLTALRSLEDAPGLLPASTLAPMIPGTGTSRTPRSATSPLCLLP